MRVCGKFGDESGDQLYFKSGFLGVFSTQKALTTLRRNRTMAAADLTAARLRELVHYEPETGVFTWRQSRHGVFAGAVAGAIGKNGYVLFQLDSLTRQAHRLAWLYVHGEWPKQNIDHINGVRYDNRIANLRDVSQRVNAENVRTVRPTSKSGVMGVFKGRNPAKWEAAIVVCGKRRYIGVFPTVEEAHAAYVAAKRIHHEGCTI